MRVARPSQNGYRHRTVFLTEERILQPPALWSSIVRETAAKKDEDPLSEWKASFKAWRSEIMKLRAFEQEDFFSDTDSPLFSRMHRGWLCDLIRKGNSLESGSSGKALVPTRPRWNSATWMRFSSNFVALWRRGTRLIVMPVLQIHFRLHEPGGKTVCRLEQATALSRCME
jgi:hypothetical protein